MIVCDRCNFFWNDQYTCLWNDQCECRGQSTQFKSIFLLKIAYGYVPFIGTVIHSRWGEGISYQWTYNNSILTQAIEDNI